MDGGGGPARGADQRADSAVRQSRPTPDAAPATSATATARPVEEEPNPPSQPIDEAFEAAGRGDAERYLAQFADPLRASLARVRATQGDAALRDYLVRLAAPIKGIAVDLARKEEVGPDSIALPVQFIFADRNESQRFTLVREGGVWRITKIDAVRAVPTRIPYGTPIQQVR